MCRDCGCDDKQGWHQHADGTWHSHDHDHDHEHEHDHHHHHHPHDHAHDGDLDHGPLKKKVIINTRQAVLLKNDQLAQDNRLWFLKNKVLCLNWISSPGTGKTQLLEVLLERLAKKFKVAVLVGDQTTSLDAQRLEGKGARIKQINTHSSCHLDAPHIAEELNDFVSKDLDLLIIENVGNLVCPSAFDLGEMSKVALLSCTEGEDKPAKYPSLFTQAQAVILTKMDLVPHLKWSLEKTMTNIRRLNAMAPVFLTSAETGLGMDPLTTWIEKRLEDLRHQALIHQDLNHQGEV